MKTLIVDTIPKDARNRGSVNLGLEIVKQHMAADVCHWSESIDSRKYETIGFNVFYPTHILNIAPFLRRHSLLNTSQCNLIAGGQGIGANGVLSGLMHDVFRGEYDYPQNATAINTEPVMKRDLRSAVIELSRGCRTRCAFCEYGHGRAYREKPIDLVKRQIDDVTGTGCTQINFLSANFAGYTEIDALCDYAISKGVSIMNCDSCITSMPRLYKWLKWLPRYLKIGIESFCPTTRTRIGKPFPDAFLKKTIYELLKHAAGIHFYLIFGLPEDNYGAWFSWLKDLAHIRQEYTRQESNLFGESETLNTKNIRFEISITNFEPCAGTPLADAPRVDFRQKAEFLDQWGKALIAYGFHKGTSVDYVNCAGRLGRKQLSYELLMALKTGGEELTTPIIDAFPHGVGRSISDKEAARFLSLAGAKIQ